MSYSKWKVEYLTALEKQTALEVLEAFPTYETREGKCKQNITQPHNTKDKIPVTRRAAKKSLKWLKHAREIQKKKNQIQITDVTRLNDEACMLCMENMFEERDDSKPKEKEQSKPVKDEDYDSDSESSDSDGSTSVDDSDIEDLDALLTDKNFMSMMGGNSALNESNIAQGESQNVFGDFGNMLGGLMSGVMSGAAPLMRTQAEFGRDKVVEMLQNPNLNPSKKAGLEELVALYKDLLDAYDKELPQEVTFQKLGFINQKATTLGVTDELINNLSQEQQMEALTKSMGNMGDECVVM